MRIAVFLLLAACGSTPPPVEMIDGPLTCQRWGMAAAANVPGAATHAKEASPSVAGDHGLLAFTSSPGAISEIYTLDHFGGSTQAVHADALDDGTDQRTPRWNTDGTRLYFSRGGALWSAAYADGTFAAPAAEPGLAGETVVGIAVSIDETELFYGDNVDPTLATIRYAKRAATGMPWTAQGPLAGLVNLSGDGAPSLTHDQLTLYWVSHRDGSPVVYDAVRQIIGAPFGQIETSADLPAGATDPDISSHDRVFAYTAHDDIVIATRTCM
ncbi:MAG: hypothetical protein ABI591_27880 [Kofleriaceae bacterium]